MRLVHDIEQGCEIYCSLHGLSSYSLSHSDPRRHKEYAKYCTKQIFTISGTVLMFNVMAGNIPQIKDVRLPCAIQTEPVVANSTGCLRWKRHVYM